MNRPDERGFEEMKVSCQFGFNDDSRCISELVVRQARPQSDQSMNATRMVVLHFPNHVFLGAFTIAERYKTGFSVFVSFGDDILSPTIEKDAVMEVIDKWLSRMLFWFNG